MMANDESITPSQLRTCDCYKWKIVDIQWRNAVIKHREEKTVQTKKGVEKKQQEYDEIGAKMDEEFSFMHVPQLEQLMKSVRRLVRPNKYTLPNAVKH